MVKGDLHEARSADDHPGLRKRRAAFAQCACNSKIGDHRVTIIEDDVVGFDVAVNDPLGVAVVERIGDFANYSLRLTGLESRRA
jgi:hypothetical protein